MDLAIVYLPPDVQDCPFHVRSVDVGIICFDREQFDRTVTANEKLASNPLIKMNLTLVNDPRED